MRVCPPKITVWPWRIVGSSVLAALLACLGFASTAIAAPTIELTRGSVEPVESITTQLGAVITNAPGNFFHLHIKPTGGAGCGANARADSGEGVFGGGQISSSSNPVTETRNWTFRAAGSYRACAWITKDGGGEEVERFAEATFVVRVPHLALSISAPATVLPSQTFQIATTATTETERQAWEYVMPNTGACPANADAAARASGASEVLGYWNVTGGPTTETKNQSLTSLGSYLICAYFQYPNREAAPELSASAQTSVIPPPPPCVVPTIRRGASVTSVEASIRAGNCSVGKLHYAASNSIGRGGVIALSLAAGSKQASGAPVDIAVSAGHPCIVPSLGAGSSVGRARRLLAAANCRAVIVHSRSRRVRRGRVIRFGSRVHSRLFPLSRVPIVVSTGP
jgi:hypothetical protein